MTHIPHPRENGSSESASTRGQIIAAALRLFGERGLDAVPVKDILEAAGQKNQSAVQYHFGSRLGLIQAVIESRVKAIDAARVKAVEAAAGLKGPRRRHALMRAMIGPLLDAVEDDPDGLLYVRLSAQALQRSDFDIVSAMGQLPGIRALSRAVQEERGRALPAAEARMRVRSTMALMFAATAEWMTTARVQMPREALANLFAKAAVSLMFEEG